jgi:hypothetical protein
VDSLYNPIWAWTDEAVVDDVLCAPGATGNLTGNIRPDGVEVQYTLHFPKTFTGSLAGRRITFDGYEYEVLGDPRPYQDENTPTRWDRPVEIKEVSG